MCFTHLMRVEVAVTVVTILDAEPHEKVGTIKAMQNLPSVMWDARMVGFLHSVFYIGFLVTMIPSGYFATKISSAGMFGGGILLSSVFNVLIPISIAKESYILTCLVRLIQGLAEGMLYPSAYAVLRHWTVSSERSRTGAIVLTGIYLGPVLGLIIAGYFTHYLGWQYVYYFNGCVGLTWFCIWLFTVYDTPAQNPNISDDELKYILSQQGESAIIYEYECIPWKAILTSVPVWVLCICNFARSFIFLMLLTNEPAYLNAFGFSLAENGVLSALPHILMTTFAALSGPLADYLINEKIFTRTQVRKIFTCGGFGTEAVCLLILVFIDRGFSAILFLTIGVGISGFTISGWQINHLDLAPRYASVLVALTTAVGTLAGILNPIIVGELTVAQTISSWHRVFLLTFFILVIAVLLYGLFGSGEMQSWAEPKPSPVRLVTKPNPFGDPGIYNAIQTQDTYQKSDSITQNDDVKTKLDDDSDSTHIKHRNITKTEGDKGDDLCNSTNDSSKSTITNDFTATHTS